MEPVGATKRPSGASDAARADLIYVDYDGTLMNKAEYLASVQSLALHPVRIVNESMNLHFYGMVAVVTGVCRENGVKNG
jgi:hypothetical protein